MASPTRSPAVASIAEPDCETHVARQKAQRVARSTVHRARKRGLSIVAARRQDYGA